MSRADGDAPRAAAREPATKDAPSEPAANENGAGAAAVNPPQKASKTSDAPAGAAKGAPPVSGFPPPGTPRPPDVDAVLHPRVDTATTLPSIPPLPAAGPWRSYKEIVANLSGRVVDAQRPIRVLNSIKWDPSVWETFKRSRYRDVPVIGPDSYGEELGFDPKQKVAEFDDLVRDIEKDLPATDEIANILRRTALEFRDVVRMLEARGTPTFYGYSRRLYGSPKDKYPDGRTTVRDSAFVLYDLLTNLQDELGAPSPRDVPATKAVDILNARLTAYFGESTVRVAEDDGIFADAAAGSDYVKIRRGAQFTMRDIDLFEVHEGWVHLATSLNGQAQPGAKRLSKGPPRTTAAQEGLAALMEIFTYRTYPRRARRLNDRVLAVDKAEDGADFVQVFDWYRTEGYDEEDCFNATRRVFRGGTTTGGSPFTKDICYSKGIVLNYAFMRACIEHDRPELIPFLFVGKIAHEDVPVLYARANDGVVKPPRYLPPTFRDLNGLAIWMSYSTFFTRLGGTEVSEHYARIFSKGASSA
jgi:uncharacterized protein (TIGR02421 family)